MGDLNRLFSSFARVGRAPGGPPLCFHPRRRRGRRLGGGRPAVRLLDTWQLVINAGTTIVTFLMVLLIQNTQNRDTEAIQLKLDELIRANTRARDRLLDLEDLGEDELERVKASFEEFAARRPETVDELRDALRRPRSAGRNIDAKPRCRGDDPLAAGCMRKERKSNTVEFLEPT